MSDERSIVVAGLGAAPPGAAPAALRAVVVVPARDEEQRIGACLDALAAQVEVEPEAYEVIVVLDACGDGTEAAVEEARRRWPDLALHDRRPAPVGRRAGPGDRHGRRLRAARIGRRRERPARHAPTPTPWSPPTGSPASWRRSRPAPRRSAARSCSTRTKPRALPSGVIRRPRGRRWPSAPALAAAPRPGRARPLLRRLASASPRAPTAGPAAWAWLAALEDQELEDRLAAAGVAIHRLRPVSGRHLGAHRRPRRARPRPGPGSWRSWLARASLRRRRLPRSTGCSRRSATSVAVILPGPRVRDDDRADPRPRCCRCATAACSTSCWSSTPTPPTAPPASPAGAGRRRRLRVGTARRSSVPACGKGDAMWRAARRRSTSDLLVFLDADTVDFEPGFLTGLLGPILLDPSLELVKGTFRRPLAARRLDPRGRRRSGHRAGRPAAAQPPLPGPGRLRAAAGRRDRDRPRPLRRLSVPVGYGVEIAMLIDASRLAGLDAPRPGRPRRPPEPPPEPARAERDGGRGDGRGRAPHRRRAAPRRTPASGRAPKPTAAPRLWRLRCEERPPLGAAGVPLVSSLDATG